MQELLSPLWEFLFEELGTFGLMISTMIPVALMGLVALAIIWVGKTIARSGQKQIENIRNTALQQEQTGDYESALRNMLKLVERKKATEEDCYRMGMICLKGVAAGWRKTNRETDPEYWLAIAADARHVGAKYQLAKYRFDRSADPLEKAQQVEKMRKAAADGSADAMRALKELEKAAEECLRSDDGNRDYNAAAMGHLDSQYFVAGLLRKGGGDMDDVMRWYHLAGRQGHARAQYACAKIYEEGENGIDRDIYEALNWYKMAAAQGYSDAAFIVGCKYYKGEGCIQDYNEAMRWFKKAAENGNSTAEYNVAVCYGRLAVAYAQKNGLRSDYARSTNREYQNLRNARMEWMRRAASHGDEDAKKALEDK